MRTGRPKKENRRRSSATVILTEIEIKALQTASVHCGYKSHSQFIRFLISRGLFFETQNRTKKWEPVLDAFESEELKDAIDLINGVWEY